MSANHRSDETLSVHHPAPLLAGFSSLAVPTYRASTISFANAADYRQRGARGVDGYSYGLAGTPTARVLEMQLTALHRGAGTVLVPSGQAAITILMLAVLKSGDHLLVTDNVYPPVRRFCDDALAAFGIATEYYDPLDLRGLARKLRRETRLIWIESPGSTTMEVCDVPAIVDLARRHGILTGCDNTWATPLLLKPLQLGVDVVVEAITKYVGGHSDLLLGSITVRSDDMHARLRGHLAMLGIGVSPDDCALALRGLETMPVRLERVGRVARELAERLAAHDAMKTVLHPALPSSPGHSEWRRDFQGASGVFSFVPKCQNPALIDAALSDLKVFVIGSSWGGTRSIIAPMQVRRSSGAWADTTFLRASVGLEDPDELWEDIEAIVKKIGADAA